MKLAEAFETILSKEYGIVIGGMHYLSINYVPSDLKERKIKSVKPSGCENDNYFDIELE